MTFWVKPRRRQRRPPRKSLQFQTLETRQLMAAEAGFEWRMEDRFGLDRDADGRIDMWHDERFIQETEFNVAFDASPSHASGPNGPVIPVYSWRVRSVETGQVMSVQGKTFSRRLAEGEYYINLTVDARSATGNPDDIDVKGEHIRVQDILVISMGDSYGAGEGNPDIPRNGNAPALWADEHDDRLPRPAFSVVEDDPVKGPHRSSKSASAIAALQLEQSDPHTSVTYVSVAWTGAKIHRESDERGNVPSATDDPTHHVLDSLSGFSQMDLAERLVGNRKIDALALSVGGNDIGFADIVTELLLRPGQNYSSISTAIRKDSVLQDIDHDVSLKLQRLSVSYADLQSQFVGRWGDQLNPQDVLLVEYADPTWDADRGTSAILGDILPGFEMDPFEIQYARERVSQRLNGRMRDAESGLGWSYVGGIANAFVGHGYAAEDPADPTTRAERARWFNTAEDSRQQQGPHSDATLWGAIAGIGAHLVGGPLVGVGVGLLAGAGTEVVDKTKTMGTLHPNQWGHQRIGESIGNHLAVRVEDSVIASPIAAMERMPFVRRVVPFAGGFDLEFDQPIDVQSLQHSLRVEDSRQQSISIEVLGAAESQFMTRVRVDLTQPTPSGYRVIVRDSLVNPYGWQLDQDRNGRGGEGESDQFVWEDFTPPQGDAYGLTQYAKVRLRFSEPIDRDSFSPGNLHVTDPRGLQTPAIQVTGLTPVPGQSSREFDVALSRFPAGGFQLIVDSGVQDLAGMSLDTNGNGVGGEGGDAWRIQHFDTSAPQILGVGVARESSIKFGGGTALVVVVADEPMMESDLQQQTRMRHVDGRAAVLGGVSKFQGQGFQGHGFQGHGYLLEFAVPDPGEYRLSLGAGIRDWFGNASSSDRDFALRFEVTRWMADGVYEGPPDASLQSAFTFDLRFDPELGLKVLEEGGVLRIDWQNDPVQAVPLKAVHDLVFTEDPDLGSRGGDWSTFADTPLTLLDQRS